ncbi:imm11 family protein [Defluviimonas salinarum]|uniref:Immunity MXAN-0049 protein domain-containing protein n=1 Tax=Defluviimonas salinarum TaxID=2992147 RepID=A0ABT3IXC8_9RHOB|nr:DUF1629 domain-containing protein [Defluviimonas salinarum]MCW3780078.1 hypothetical protein [Defluviimonas salinarum]
MTGLMTRRAVAVGATAAMLGGGVQAEGAEERKVEGMVYHISGGKYVTDYLGSQPGYKALDGDIDKVEIVDPTPDGGGLITRRGLKSGRPMKPDHMPTKLQRIGRGLDIFPLLDVDSYTSCLLVNQTFKDILEELEPGVHQFFPMEIFIKDEKVGDRYWLNICNRLDTYHPTLTYPRNERGFFEPVKGEPFSVVFSVDAIGNHHAWHDKFGQGTYISDTFAERLQAAVLSGLHFSEPKPQQ